jgi:hypothetical protein
MNIFLQLDADDALLGQLMADASVDGELLGGGVAAFPVTWLQRVEFLSVVLFSTFAQRSLETLEASAGAGRADHVLIDRFYQEMWPASWSRYRGLYGASGIDPGTPKVDLPSSTIRVRHRRLPAYIARTQNDLERIADACASIAGESGRVLYRGQNRQYQLPRTRAARHLLFGEATVPVEPKPADQRTSSGARRRRAHRSSPIRTSRLGVEFV